jgi:hypothetical protein
LPIDQLDKVFTVATSAQRAAFLKFMTAILDPARDLPLMAIAAGVRVRLAKLMARECFRNGLPRGESREHRPPEIGASGSGIPRLPLLR